jgi:hypothetical protein
LTLNTPGFRGSRPDEQARRQLGPGGQETAADHQQNVGPQSRFAWRRYHPTGVAHDAEITKKCPRIHVVDGGAELFRKGDCRSNSRDVGPQARNDRQATRAERSSRFGCCGLKCHGLAVDPSATHSAFP